MNASQRHRWSLVCLALFGLVFQHYVLVQAQSNSQSCTDHGKVYERGDTWADAQVCDFCECNQYGTQCHAGLDGGPCKLKNMTVSPGDPVCVYNYRLHLVGDVFSTLDGCNKCLCTEHGMQCTAHACKTSGFDTYSIKPLYGECLYDAGGDDKWYMLHSHWLARDGCNTCYCLTVGNYRGQHVCTTSTCKCATSTVVG